MSHKIRVVAIGHTHIHLWNIETGSAYKPLKLQGKVKTATLRGSILSFAYEQSKEIIVYNFETETTNILQGSLKCFVIVIHSLGHSKPIIKLSKTYFPHLIISSSQDGTLRTWNIQTSLSEEDFILIHAVQRCMGHEIARQVF